MPIAPGGPIISSAFAQASFHGDAVQDTAALTALLPAERFDKQERFVEDDNETYYFDLQSPAASSPPDILVPDDSPAAGRWIKLSPSGGVPATHKDTHKSGGGDAFTATDLIEAIVKRLQTTTGPTTLLMGAVADGQFLKRAGTALVGAAAMSFPTILFLADHLSLPNNADWIVNALAPLGQDPVNNGFAARFLDDSTEEGVGLEFVAPVATNLLIGMVTRAVTAPGGAVVAKARAYNRGIKLTPAAIEAFSAAQNLTDVDLPITTRFPHYDQTTISYASFGITAGELTQIEITRNGADAGDTLVGDLALLGIILDFS